LRRTIEVGLGSSAVLLTQLWPPQLRGRSTPNSRHHSDGPEHLRFVPFTDLSICNKVPSLKVLVSLNHQALNYLIETLAPSRWAYPTFPRFAQDARIFA
jgi:hypothetical protein